MKLSSLKMFILCLLATLLAACGTGQSSTWAKKSSPWESSSRQAAAVVADTKPVEPVETESYSVAAYKEEPLVDDQELQEVELSYQGEVVEADDAQATEASYEDSSPLIDNIASMPGHYYTVQLMASVDMDRVYKFAKKHQLSTRYIVATQRGDTVWYVLLLNVYPDYSAAKMAMKDVAHHIKTTPWVRKLAAIQKLMQ